MNEIAVYQDVSGWLTELDGCYIQFKRSGWEFAVALTHGIDQFGSTPQAKAELYELASKQLNCSVKTLRNYVSVVRNPAASVAIELGLEIGHANAVLGLPGPQAESVLHEAAERMLSVEATRYMVHEAKHPDSRNEPPFANPNSVLYTEQGPEQELVITRSMTAEQVVAALQLLDAALFSEICKLLLQIPY